MVKRNRLHVAIKGNKTTKDIKFLEASPHSNIYIFRLTELPAAGFKSITHNLARVLKGRRRCENTRTDQTGASPLIAHTSAKTVLPTIFSHERKSILYSSTDSTKASQKQLSCWPFALPFLYISQAILFIYLYFSLLPLFFLGFVFMSSLASASSFLIFSLYKGERETEFWFSWMSCTRSKLTKNK